MMRSRFTKSAHALSQYGGRTKPAGAAVAFAAALVRTGADAGATADVSAGAAVAPLATLLSLPTRAFGFAARGVPGVDASPFMDLAATLVVLRAAPFKPVAAMSSAAAVLRRAFATVGTTAPFKVASWAAAPSGDTLRADGR